jgi:hypothetical protein
MIEAVKYTEEKSLPGMFLDKSDYSIFIAQTIRSYPIEKPKVIKAILENSYYLLPIKVIEELKKDYIFVEPERILKFLLANRDLILILQEVPEYIYGIFGPSVLNYLELHSDPEEEWDELFIVIKSPYTAEKAVALERELFDEWFVHIMDKFSNKLNFTEEPL